MGGLRRIALLLVDRSVGWTEIHDELSEALAKLARPTIIVGTKEDLGRAKQNAWPLPEAPADWPQMSVSAKSESGLEPLLDAPRELVRRRVGLVASRNGAERWPDGVVGARVLRVQAEVELARLQVVKAHDLGDGAVVDVCAAARTHTHGRRSGGGS